MRLYDRHSIKQLIWPNTDEGRYARGYLAPILQEGSQKFVDNVDTTIMVLHDQDLILPITINETQYDNSYVCSPYGQYIRYGIDELEIAVNPTSRPFVKGALNCLGKLLKIGQINKTVHVNNWLLSTNLYPSITDAQAQAITTLLAEKFPDHAILFRSVNTKQTTLMNTLKSLGYFFQFSREIFLLDTQQNEPFKERHFKKDLKLLEDSKYEVVEPNQFNLEDIPRIAELYHALNIEKYSKQNPQFTKKFIELSLNGNALNFRGLRKNGSLDAVYGSIKRNDTMVAPFFGYDTEKPEELGLYRQLSALAVMEAKDKNLTLNQSAGAASFKKRRKAEPVIEYHAVYVKHLPVWRQAPWQTLKQIGEKLMIPFVQKMNI